MNKDIEIAQNTQLEHILNVAKKLDIKEDDLEYYGKYKAKLSDELIDRVKENKDGKLINKYDSLKTASKNTNIDDSSIGAVCNNKRKTAGGYVWKFI